MKLKELIDLKDMVGYTNEISYLEKYQDEECVIFYEKNKLGLLFVIKTAKTTMPFIELNKSLTVFFNMTKRTRRVNLKTFFEAISDLGIVLDKETFSNMKKNLLLEELE